MSHFVVNPKRAIAELSNPSSEVYASLGKEDTDEFIRAFHPANPHYLGFLSTFIDTVQNMKNPLIETPSNTSIKFFPSVWTLSDASYYWMLVAPQLQISTASYPLRGLYVGTRGVKGMIDFLEAAAKAGNETLDNVQVIRSGGNTQISNSDGNVQVSNSDGNVQVTRSNGNVQVSSSGGSVSVTYR